MSFLKVINLSNGLLKRKLLKEIPLSLITDNLKTKYPDIEIEEDNLVYVNSLNSQQVPIYSPNSLNLYMLESLFYNDGKDTGFTTLKIDEKDLNNLFKLRSETLSSLGYKVDIQYMVEFTFMIKRDYTLAYNENSSDIILAFPLYYLNYSTDANISSNENFQKSIVKTIFELLDFTTLSEEEYLYIKENCITR